MIWFGVILLILSESHSSVGIQEDNGQCITEECFDLSHNIDTILIIQCPSDEQYNQLIMDTFLKLQVKPTSLITFQGDRIRRHLEVTKDELVSIMSYQCTDNNNNTIYGDEYDSIERTLSIISNELQKSRNSDELHIISVIGTSVYKRQYHKNMYETLLPLISNLVELSDPQYHAFHFFINSTIERLHVIGNPLYAIQYNDSTHFNKALTLNNMILSRDTHNLQAHLLSRGIHVQVSDINMLYTLLHYSSPLHMKFIDYCVIQACSLTSFCSPLHGCVPRDRLHERDSEDRTPLQVNFKMSHDDMMTSYHRYNNDIDIHYQLSILDNSTVSSISLSDVVHDTVDIIQWTPNKPFVEHVITRKKPVLLQSTVVSEWKATNMWNMAYVSQHIDMNILPSVKCTNSLLTFDADVRAPLNLTISLPYLVQNMSRDMFFSCVEDPYFCNDGFKGHYYFGSVPDSLKSDLMPDKYLYHTEKDYKARRQFIWISSSGMITHGHFDQDYNFFIQLVGQKKFTLWFPWEHELLYTYPRVHPLWHKSRVNFAAPDVSRFPGFAKSHAVEVIVSPGDVLFIPPYTWHYVETLSPSISLSTWSHDYHLYDHMNSIYRHDHKFDLIADPKGETVCIL